MNQKEKTQSRVFVPLRHFTEKSFLNRSWAYSYRVNDGPIFFCFNVFEYIDLNFQFVFAVCSKI